jgi:hypothetical protein
MFEQIGLIVIRPNSFLFCSSSDQLSSSESWSAISASVSGAFVQLSALKDRNDIIEFKIASPAKR